MSNVAVVTDGSHCLPPDLVREYNIHTVNANLIIKGKTYKDNELTNSEFWKLFYQASGQVTSSAANIGDFITIFNKLVKSTNNIACIVVSKEISRTYESAVQASKMVQSEHPSLRIMVIDSKTAAGALGFIVLTASRAAKKGMTLDEVISIAQDMIPKVKLVLGLETLKYLIKGGRAPKTGYIGELMNIKPIIGSVSGKGTVELLGKARGKRRCLFKLVEMIKEHTDTNKPVNIMVHYTSGMDTGEELKEIITSQVECGEIYLTPLTPAMCSHLGPVVAVSFYTDS